MATSACAVSELVYVDINSIHVAVTIMPKYLLVYHGGQGSPPTSQEEIDKVMAAWMGWFGSLGDAVVDGGNPVGMSRTVHPGGAVTDGGGPASASGYSILQASDDDAILEMAKGCPHLADGGTVEVAQIHQM